MNKYMVKRVDGTLLVVAAESYRRHDGCVLFEICNYDQNLPAQQQWRTVTSLPETDIVQITIARPPGEPVPVASSFNGQYQSRT